MEREDDGSRLGVVCWKFELDVCGIDIVQIKMFEVLDENKNA